MRRIKRFAEFELALTIHEEGFIRPPRESQRNWVVNRAIAELVDELRYLDRRAPNFIAGGTPLEFEDRTQQVLPADQIMEDWQRPVMERMARIVTAGHGDVLEIGFGRGVSAEFIQTLGVRSHTIVECNDSIVAEFERWRARHDERAIRILHGLWQDVLADTPAESFDGVFFHAYPLNAQEHADYSVQDVTFAAHFLPTAARLLRPGGVLTYLTNESDSFSRAHQRLLFEYFEELSLSLARDLAIPNDSRDAMWQDSMVIVRATYGAADGVG